MMWIWYSRETVSSFHTTLEKLSSTIGGIIPDRSRFSYLWEARAYLDAFRTGDTTFYWTKSEDGGLTCPSFGDGTKSILSHSLVLQELESYCPRLASGKSELI